MKYYIVIDHKDVPLVSLRLYQHNVPNFTKQLYSVHNEPEAHIVFDKPENMSYKDVCAICGVKEAYLYFDTKEEWV
jgi:hypothetical protein